MLKFSDETKNIVSDLRNELLKSGRLSTNPNGLLFMSYDAYDIIKDKTPDESICRFTIEGLKHIFPLIDIRLGSNNEILVEGEHLCGYQAWINKNYIEHIDYIKEIMLDIFVKYQNDENKVPKHMYSWYFNTTAE